eukprot:6206735-Pleurochrysis_carterae.AAC.1
MRARSCYLIIPGSSRRPIRTPTNELHKRLQKDVCSTCGMLTSAFGSGAGAVILSCLGVPSASLSGRARAARTGKRLRRDRDRRWANLPNQNA